MNTENQIEFNKVKELWSEFAITDYAKDMIGKTWIFTDETKLRKQLRDTTNSRIMIEKLGEPPLQNVSEMKEILDVAKKGDCLTPYQLLRVENILVASDRL